MPRVMLHEDFTYNGQEYLAGERDIPDEMYQSLQERGILDEEAQGPLLAEHISREIAFNNPADAAVPADQPQEQTAPVSSRSQAEAEAALAKLEEERASQGRVVQVQKSQGRPAQQKATEQAATK